MQNIIPLLRIRCCCCCWSSLINYSTYFIIQIYCPNALQGLWGSSLPLLYLVVPFVAHVDTHFRGNMKSVAPRISMAEQKWSPDNQQPEGSLIHLLQQMTCHVPFSWQSLNGGEGGTSKWMSEWVDGRNGRFFIRRRRQRVRNLLFMFSHKSQNFGTNCK